MVWDLLAKVRLPKRPEKKPEPEPKEKEKKLSGGFIDERRLHVEPEQIQARLDHIDEWLADNEEAFAPREPQPRVVTR